VNVQNVPTTQHAKLVNVVLSLDLQASQEMLVLVIRTMVVLQLLIFVRLVRQDVRLVMLEDKTSLAIV
jgi:hypothetical protein